MVAATLSDDVADPNSLPFAGNLKAAFSSKFRLTDRTGRITKKKKKKTPQTHTHTHTHTTTQHNTTQHNTTQHNKQEEEEERNESKIKKFVLDDPFHIDTTENKHQGYIRMLCAAQLCGGLSSALRLISFSRNSIHSPQSK